MLATAVSSAPNVIQRCDAFDREQEMMLIAAGGAEYVLDDVYSVDEF